MSQPDSMRQSDAVDIAEVIADPAHALDESVTVDVLHFEVGRFGGQHQREQHFFTVPLSRSHGERLT